MKYFVSTGEASGDLHLSYIVNEIKSLDKEASFFGVAGKHSEKAGVNIVQDIKELAVMGFVEAISKYSFLKKKLNEYIEYIKNNNIEKLILVDYGGFNLKFLERIRAEKLNVEVYYYIPPKVWIWGKKRLEKLKLADHIMVIFPWEVEFYKENSMKAVYFGNPFMEKYEKVKINGENILLLPGSRRGEVKSLTPSMLDVVKNSPNQNFIMKLASKEHVEWIEDDVTRYKNLEIRDDLSLEEAVKLSKYAIAASGTVILELAMLALPGIVIYKTSKINEFIVKNFINLTYVSLPNLTLNKEVYPELLQAECTAENIIREMNKLEDKKENVMKDIDLIREKLNGDNIIKSYAEYIVNSNKKNNLYKGV